MNTSHWTITSEVLLTGKAEPSHFSLSQILEFGCEGSGFCPSEFAAAARFQLVLHHLFGRLRGNRQRLFENASCQALFAEAACSPFRQAAGCGQGARRHLAALSGDTVASGKGHLRYTLFLWPECLSDNKAGPSREGESAAPSSQVASQLMVGRINSQSPRVQGFLCCPWHPSQCGLQPSHPCVP